MAAEKPLAFTRYELESLLPSGWGLLDATGSWDGRRKRWTGQLRDPADNDWPLSVSAASAVRLGRLEALRLAIDRLYREALG